MPPPSPLASTLFRVLQACAASPLFREQVRLGRVYEDEVLLALATLANEVGLGEQARLMELTATTHPLLVQGQDAPGGYHQQMVISFLQCGDRFLRLDFGALASFPRGKRSLVAMDFPTHQDALAAVPWAVSDHSWRPSEKYNDAGDMAMIGTVLSIEALRTELCAIALGNKAPTANKSSSCVPRL